MQRVRVIVILILIAVAAVFGRVCGHEFVSLDDPVTIAGNPDFDPPRVEGLLWYWKWHREPDGRWAPNHKMSIYKPLTDTVWWVLAKVAHVEGSGAAGEVRLLPGVYHAASVVVHAVAALAVFAVLRRLSGHDWAAAAGAGVFAVHPVQVEAVAWASGMKDLLCGMFGAMAVWQYVVFAQGEGESNRSAEADPTGAGRGWLHLAAATGCFVLAVLSKPTGVVVPLMCAVIDLVVVRRPVAKVAAALTPWLVIAAGGAWVASLVQPAAGVENAPMWARPLVAADAIVFYLYKLAAPIWLAPDYGRRPTVVMEGWQVWAAWVVPAALAVLVWRARRREPLVAAAALLFVVPLLPVLGLRTFLMQYYSTVADHYLYLPMLGVGLLVAWLVRRCPSRRVGVGVAAVMLALGVRSVLAAGNWADDRTLWRNVVTVNPRSFAGWMSLAAAEQHAGGGADVEGMYQNAIEAGPHHAKAYETYANYLIQTRRAREAIAPLRQELRLNEALPPRIRPDTSSRRLLLGHLLLATGQHGEAAAEFEEVLRRRPGDGRAAAGLAEARRATPPPR